MDSIGRKIAMNIEKKLYQWDTGQKLTGCTGLYVDFPIDNEVYRVETADGTCIIPDELLQTAGKYRVYECMTNNTIRAFAFSVTPRPMPPDYVYTPTERLTFEGLVQKVDDAVADMIRRAESGEFDGHTPVKGTDYFTASEIQQIQNEVSSGAIGEFKSVVDTETDKFNANATEKVNTYNQNDSQKTTSYNANATAKLNAYNTNANNRVAEFDSHTEQIQTDISELKSDFNDITSTTRNLWTVGDVYVDSTVNNPEVVSFELEAGTYTFSAEFVSSDTDSDRCSVSFRSNGTEIVGVNPKRTGRPAVTFTLGSAINQVAFYASDSWGHSKNDTATISNIQIERGSVATPYILPITAKDDTARTNANISLEANYLYGKKYVAAGDSYTAWSDAKYIDGKYANLLVTYDREIRLRNAMDGINAGQGGSTMALAKDDYADKATADANAFSNTRYVNIPSDTDILTISFGINDSSICNLGQLGDTQNTTFYGAWDKVLNYYATNRPEMKIGIICFARSNNAFYQAVLDIAQYYGIPLLDFYGGRDTPMYVDGKAYPVDETIKATRKAYFGGHAHASEVDETFRGKTYKTTITDGSPGHPGYRAHIDEATIIEDFLRRL